MILVLAALWAASASAVSQPAAAQAGPEDAAALLSAADEALPPLLAALRSIDAQRQRADLTRDALAVHALAESDLDAHCRLAGAVAGMADRAEHADEASVTVAVCRKALAAARLAQIRADTEESGKEAAALRASWPAEADDDLAACDSRSATAARLSCLVRRRDEEQARLTGAYDALDAIGAPRTLVEDARIAFQAYAEAECRLLRDMADAPTPAEKAMTALPCEAEAAASRTAALRALRRKAGLSGPAAAREGL